MKNKFQIAMTLAVILAMAFTSLALADVVTPDADIVTPSDQASQNLGTVAPGATLTPKVSFKLVCSGKNHVDTGQTVNLNFNLAGSTVPAGSLTATNAAVGPIVDANWPDDTTGSGSTNCATTPEVLGDNGDSTVTITAPMTAGNYSYVVRYNFAFSPSQGSGDANDIVGSNTTVTFTLTVVANTAPSISVTGVSHGSSYNKGSVPAAMCDVTDAEDNPADFAATLSAITGSYAVDGIGSQTATCSYTDTGGLTANASATYSIVDPSAPSISYVLTPLSPDGSNGWYKSDVTLVWNVSEPDSPSSLAKTGCVNQNITADQNATTYSCSASSAGGSAAQVNVTIKRDATPPTISFVSPSTAVWYNAAVTANWSCSDALSGAASATATATTSGEGSAVPATGTCTDNAGNSAGNTQSFMIDLTAPSISASATKADASAYTADTWTNQDVTVHYACTDGGSGVASVTADQPFSAEGITPSTSGTCVDNAGNNASAFFGPIKIDKTAPSISAQRDTAANADGWNNTDVDSSYTASDALSGLASPATGSFTFTAEGAGQSHTFTVTDLAGNSASATVIDVNIDKTAPSISAQRDTAANANGWNNTNVDSSYTASDALSGLVSPATGSFTFTAEGAGQFHTFTVSDKAGNSASATVSDINIDKTAPSISAQRDTAANADGWNNTDVDSSYTASDALSGLDSPATGSFTFTSEGAGQSHTFTVADKAGNSASASVSGINIDKTAPSVSASAAPAANANGWNKTNVTVTFSGTDSLSGIASCDAPAVLSAEGAGQSASGNCTDKAGNSASASVSGINIDKTAPSVSASAAPAANANGWNKTNVTVSFSGTDSLSGIDSCDAAAVLSAESAGQSASGSCTDKAGNTASASASGINIDKTAPVVALVGGPADGGSYYFGFVPAAPTCSASDGLSGLDGACAVSGYSTAVGPHTVSAIATDKAGNSASASASYTVGSWTAKGFYQPVDMGKLNVAKNGSTVPLKFEVFAGTVELTDVNFIKQSFVQTLTCGSGIPTDDIENYATGGTSLRYDTTGGQFIFNWQTPKTPGACYRVTLTLQDNTTITADFKLK